MRKFVCTIQTLSFLLGLVCHVSAGVGTSQSNAKVFDGKMAAEVAAAQKQKYRLKGRAGTLRPSPAQEKLSTDLLQLVDDRFLPTGTKIADVLSSLQAANRFVPGNAAEEPKQKVGSGRVYVYIYFNQDGGPSILDPLAVTITDSDASNRYVAAWVQVNALESIATLDGVRAIRPVFAPMTQAGSVQTEGDAVHGTQDVRCMFSQRGAGIKVGVISDGVDHRAEAQDSLDLPPDGAGLTVLRNDFGGDEGTAMLEIIHDMAPDAPLYFHDAGSNSISFGYAIDAMVAAGCDIICDDVVWIGAPFFEEGPVAARVRSILDDNNIIYVSAAGNSGNKHYQGQFHSLSGFPDFHDFSHGTENLSDLYLNMPSGSGVTIVLQWDDPFGAASSDYDLYLVSYAAGGIIQLSEILQDGDDDPVEALVYTANAWSAGDFAIWVIQYNGTGNETLEVFIYPSGWTGIYANNRTSADSIFGHKAVPGVVAVGAIDAGDPGQDSIESFSSRGPATISHPVAETRPKPEICALDRVSVTGVGDFGTMFPGTSAAAPHVAAVMAQVWSAMPQYSGDEIRDMVLAEAVDLGVPGFDNTFGNGRVDALNTFNAYYTGIYPFSITEDFETGTGLWVNVIGSDTDDWTRAAGPAAASTGPDGGANGSTWYMGLKTSSGDASAKGDTAILQSTEIGGTDRVLTFSYHMYGSDIGTLSVDVHASGLWIQDVWSLSGQQQTSRSDTYRQGTVDLGGYTGPIRIRLRAVAAGGSRGDIAIDNIEIAGLDDADVFPPAAPAGLSLTLNGDVSLDWDDNCEPDLASYTVYRSTTSGSGYSSIASGLVNSNYVDTSIAPETMYYYVVTAVDTASNESVYSAEVNTEPEPQAVLAEDFETGDFSAFDWTFAGDAPWTVTSATSQSGTFSAQAGDVGNDEESTLALTLECPAGQIGFFYRVSSESGFDFLEFSIDGVRQDRWSGQDDWTQVSFPVAEGTRTFEWTYSKDGSVSIGADTAWIDDVYLQ